MYGRTKYSRAWKLRAGKRPNILCNEVKLSIPPSLTDLQIGLTVPYRFTGLKTRHNPGISSVPIVSTA